MKKLFILMMLSVMTFVCVLPSVTFAGDYMEYLEPEVKLNIVENNTTIKYPFGESKKSVFCNGRLCVPLKEGVSLMGGKSQNVAGSLKIAINNKNYFVNKGVSSNRPRVFTYNNEEYISIYEITAPFDYEPVVNLSANTVEIMAEKSLNNYSQLSSNSKGAYIRFEDITADGLKPNGTGNYTVDMLEKLKYTAEYMYQRNQQYYIAWIPVYACPALSYWNDVSKDYNLYNSYFLYVIDYMVDHNGHLGLHGYTHQYGNDESAIGYEWGENTPYNFNEQQRRMVAAKETCHKLGYKDEFFEFPHYGATDAQMKMAENYFDAVYQSYPDNKHYNYLTYTARSGKCVYYIPTPADYVHYRRDESIFDRIKNSISNGYTLSLFYHPVIDNNQFEIDTLDNKRVWKYSDEGTLPSIVNYVANLGYSFSSFK